MGKRKLRVCFVAPVPPPYGGIANWMKMITEYIDQNKQDEIEYQVVNTAPKIRVTEGRKLWHRVIDGGILMLQRAKKFNDIIKDNSFDVIHITSSGSLSVIRDYLFCKIARYHKVRVCCHIRFGRIPEIIRKNTLEWKILRWVFKQCDQVIAIDKRTEECLKKQGYQNVNYIPNPIERKKMGAVSNEEEKVIMYLGWVIPEKGIEELLQAWGQLQMQYPDWRLRIVGPIAKEYQVELTQKYHMNAVDIVGELEHGEAMELLEKAGIFVLPSHTEGSPNVILEAMALHRAIIATNVGSIPEMLSNRCGITIKKKNVNQLIKALKVFLDSERKRRIAGKNAGFKIEQEYEFDFIFKKYEMIWRENNAIR